MEQIEKEENEKKYSLLDCELAIDAEIGEFEIELEKETQRGDEWRRRYWELKRDYEQAKKQAKVDRSRGYHWRDKAIEKQRRIRRLSRENLALIAELEKIKRKVGV